MSVNVHGEALVVDAGADQADADVFAQLRGIGHFAYRADAGALLHQRQRVLAGGYRITIDHEAAEAAIDTGFTQFQQGGLADEVGVAVEVDELAKAQFERIGGIGLRTRVGAVGQQPLVLRYLLLKLQLQEELPLY